MKPFLQIRKAIKRNASFISDDVRSSLLNLLDALEQDVADIPEDDEVFEFSAITEKYSEELKENLRISDKKTDEEEAKQEEEGGEDE